MPAVALSRPAGGGPGLGDAEVQRVVGGVGELPVGLDHQRHGRRLHRDLHVVEADLVEVGQLDAAADSTIASGVTLPPCFS